MVQPGGDEHLNDLVVHHIRAGFVWILASDSVAEALARVRQSQVDGPIVYFYVVDAEDRLQGVVPTRRLLLSAPETKIADIMERKLVVLPATATLLDACEFFIIHRLLALPVVDDDGRILGVVDVELYTDEISDLASRQESEDVFQLIGVRLAQVRQASIPAAFRWRFPWLLSNIAGGLACAFLAAAYERVLDNVIVLAMFIPIVLTLAESVSIQSLTITLQMHESGGSRGRLALRALRREATVGALLGLASGSLVGAVAFLWQGRGAVAMCIWLSIALAVAMGAIFGMAVPTALRAVKRDPKVASGPIALAMTDVATLTAYLGLASTMLG